MALVNGLPKQTRYTYNKTPFSPINYKMNRRKKINETLKRKAKKANAKLHKSNKPKYISKAERAKLNQELEANNDSEQLPVE